MRFTIQNAQLLAVGGMILGASAVDLPKFKNLDFRNLDLNLFNSPTLACEFFKLSYPGMTILPTDANYTAENEVSWSASAWLGPACILAPANAEEMSCAVKNLVRFATPFAIRGGGHMPNSNAANINSTGVLISSTNLKTMELSADGSKLALAPGNRWGDAYIYLDSTKTGKMVVGGRYAPVGVPGYLLGGGMSFYSYEYGFSSTNGNVDTYECVLSNGKIVEARATGPYADLYWALQGGGNSFCIVTKFILRTIDSSVIGLANPSYGFGEDVKGKWLTSILNYVINGSSDPKAAIIPVARYAAGFPSPRYDVTLFHNSPNISKPAIFSDFQGGLLPATTLTTLSHLTMGQFSQAVFPAFKAGGESFGLRQRFHVVSHAATLQAMTIVHDTFFDAVIAHNLTSLAHVFVGLAWNSITTKFIEASNSGIGCPQGITEEPLFWVEEAISWGDSADDAAIDNFVVAVNRNITAQLTAIGATRPYIYLNDAEDTQAVFQGYPAANVQRLKQIRAKYDPFMIYTNLMPGGFKVAHA